MNVQLDIKDILLSIPWLMDLTDQQASKLAGIAGVRRLLANEELYAEGSREDFLYICIDGQLAVEMQVPGRGQVRIYIA